MSGTGSPPASAARPKLIKRLAGLFILGAVFVGSLYLGKSWWLPVPAALLMADDSIDRADVIFVLSGHSRWRVPVAARLYRAAWAPRIVIGGGADNGEADDDLLWLATGQRLSEAETNARVLERLGVPREDVVVLADSTTSTYHEAVAFKKYVRAHSVKSAILVTSHLHSRRAGWVFRRVLNNPTSLAVRLHVVEAEQPHFAVRNWWQHEEGLITVFNEYVKLAYYVGHY